MRLYTFVNYYLSSIQQGIQTAHIVSEMSNYSENFPDYFEWASCHKTIIVLNGGNNKNINEIINFLSTYDEYLSVFFDEDQESLGGLTTSVGIIVPEKIWSAIDSCRTEEDQSWKSNLLSRDIKLVEFIAFFSLAR